MKKFIKNKENFKCEQCGFFVVGDGYTNHCPQCLWSKHVDINPGDRLASCGGLMKPVLFESNGRRGSIVHECVVCRYCKKNRLSREDNFVRVIEITQENTRRA